MIILIFANIKKLFLKKTAITPEATANGVEVVNDKSPDVKDPKDSPTKPDDSTSSIKSESMEKISGRKRNVLTLRKS